MSSIEEITPREILFSIIIFCIMIIVGTRISEVIVTDQSRKNREYYSAQKITDPDQFEYGMKTNIGNAFVYGSLEAVDTVTYPEIGGAYTYVSKDEIRYRRHETEETEKDANGKEHTVKKVYYQWDTVDSESIHAKEIKFLDHVFPYEKIPYKNSKYITVINGDRVYDFYSGEFVKVKFEYYGSIPPFTGTIYTNLKDGTIEKGTSFYNKQNINETIKQFTSGAGIVIFWFFWILLTIGLVIGFCAIRNDWLE